MSKNKKILIMFIILGSLVSTSSVGAMKRKKNNNHKKTKTTFLTQTNPKEISSIEEIPGRTLNGEEAANVILKLINKKYNEFQELKKACEDPNLKTTEECENLLNSLSEINDNIKYCKIHYIGDKLNEIYKIANDFNNQYHKIKENLQKKKKIIEKIIKKRRS